MIQLLASKKQNGVDWVDLSAPDDKEIKQVAKEYGLHEASIKDCMQPDHLPKHELFDNYTFVIVRVLASAPLREADTIQELTNKISIFFGRDFLITVHRTEHNLINLVKTKQIDTNRCKSPFFLFTTLTREAILTFEPPGIKLSESLDYYEEQVFLRQRKGPILRSLYFVKRKIDVIR